MPIRRTSNKSSYDSGFYNPEVYSDVGGGVFSYFSSAVLDVNFAKNRSLVDSVSNTTLITFTRSGTATYVDSDGLVKTAANNIPRFDHDFTTRESLGLLLEESATNVLLQSEAFATSPWVSISSPVVTANTDTSPAGTLTADKVSFVSSSYIRQIKSGITSGATYTISVWAKKASVNAANFIRLTSNNTAAWSTGFSQKFELTDSWQRLSATGVLISSGSSCYVIIGTKDKDNNNDADCVGDVLLWGAQLERSDTSTSYIPTTSTTATRNVDAASITGTSFTSWYNSSEGTLYAAATFGSGTRADATPFGVANGGVGSANPLNMTLRFLNSTTSRFVVNSTVAGVYAPSISDSNIRRKMALAYKDFDFGSASTGVSGAPGASGTVPTVNQAIIGSAPFFTSAGHLRGHVQRIAAWSTKFPDSVLRSITQE